MYSCSSINVNENSLPGVLVVGGLVLNPSCIRKAIWCKTGEKPNIQKKKKVKLVLTLMQWEQIYPNATTLVGEGCSKMNVQSEHPSIHPYLTLPSIQPYLYLPNTARAWTPRYLVMNFVYVCKFDLMPLPGSAVWFKSVFIGCIVICSLWVV